MASVDRPQALSWVKRYAPFLVIVAFQLVLIAQGPTSTTTSVAPTDQVDKTASDTGTGAVAGTGEQATGTVAGGASLSSGGAAPTGATSAAKSATSGAQAAKSSAATVPGAGKAQATGAPQQVDPLGRPVTGDKSKCAPGGLVQDNISYAPVPCMPKFTGDNGGHTY